MDQQKNKISNELDNKKKQVTQKCLIMCPGSLVFHWAAEVERHFEKGVFKVAIIDKNIGDSERVLHDDTNL